MKTVWPEFDAGLSESRVSATLIIKPNKCLVVKRVSEISFAVTGIYFIASKKKKKRIPDFMNTFPRKGKTAGSYEIYSTVFQRHSIVLCTNYVPSIIQVLLMYPHRCQ